MIDKTKETRETWLGQIRLPFWGEEDDIKPSDISTEKSEKKDEKAPLVLALDQRVLQPDHLDVSD